jgi:hypothetical protein
MPVAIRDSAKAFTCLERAFVFNGRFLRLGSGLRLRKRSSPGVGYAEHTSKAALSAIAFPHATALRREFAAAVLRAMYLAISVGCASRITESVLALGRFSEDD